MFGWLSKLIRWFGKGRTASPSPSPTAKPGPTGQDIADAWLREHEARTGDTERPDQAAGWALMLRSPYQSWDNATSWLGGLPHAPPGFDWPHAADGTLLHFLAQIDLAALHPHPDTGARPPGLPQQGALLVFASYTDFAVITLPQADMARAVPVDLPPDLAALDTIHHWRKEPTFTRWPVVPLAFQDDGTGWPAALPKPFAEPAQWITTWGMARHEADFVLASAEKTLRNAPRPSPTPPDPRSVSGRNAAFHAAIAEPAFQDMLSVLKRWRDTAASQDPDAPVDAKALRGLFALRRRLTEGLPNQALVLALRGWPSQLWQDLGYQHGQAIAAQDTSALPPGLRPFVEANITGWRGHRLFGLHKELPYNDQDRRGHDLLVSISSDALIGTPREHTGGTSIWSPRDALAVGDHTRGMLIHQGNG